MDGKDKTKGQDLEAEKVKVTIRITCRNVKTIEKVTTQLVDSAKAIEGVIVKGPRRMPIKYLSVTCRRTPCGQGSKTWDKYELKIYKRVIDLECLNQDIRAITSINLDPGVEIELSMRD